MSNATLWRRVNRALVAKIISELQYEECFQPMLKNGDYVLQLQSGVNYQFCAWQTIWQQLRVNESSLLRNGTPVEDAGQFFIDAQAELQLDDIVLANLLEECLHTLSCDMQSWRLKSGFSAHELAAIDVDRQQCYLDGHPKAVLNKGRLGWGIDALEKFAPEYQRPVRLRWLAAQAELCDFGSQNMDSYLDLLRSAMSEVQWQSFQLVHARFLNERWVVIPVHPWQWQQKLQIHYRAQLEAQQLVDLGEWGCRFLPLQSIRTLANLDNPQAPNIKLPITILNTSCYRGIPGKYIKAGASLSQWLSALCEHDVLLKRAQTLVLEEPFGVHVAHPLFLQVAGAPYRYHETLGVIWRSSIQAKLQSTEQALLMAALLQTDHYGASIIGYLIQRSNLAADVWLRRLFNVVVVPLYHLMCQYGVGLVAHSQNLTLIVQDAVPVRLAIKDLQGDLRIVDQAFPELSSLPEDVATVLTKLPPEYLVHDLQTGHFVTVLRYLSALMQEQSLLEESEFYQVLARCITDYQKLYPQLHTRFQMFDLLAPTLKRVCINRVRFSEGYGDSADRPLPTLGTDLANPLYICREIKKKEYAV